MSVSDNVGECRTIVMTSVVEQELRVAAPCASLAIFSSIEQARVTIRIHNRVFYIWTLAPFGVGKVENEIRFTSEWIEATSVKKICSRKSFPFVAGFSTGTVWTEIKSIATFLTDFGWSWLTLWVADDTFVTMTIETRTATRSIESTINDLAPITSDA